MNPTTVRLSDTLLLSDCVGCDSVYRYGYANPVTWGKRSAAMAEAKKLAALADEIHELHGPYSVSYGYICPELSKKIVKYQDPTKPSYHRWDDGAAIDVCLHDTLEEAPIYAARKIDDLLHYSRMITYSESPWVCIATRVSEEQPRMAFYENRYTGERKPKFIKYSANRGSRQAQKTERLEVHWEGNGYPTYHGGGRLQLHHRRLATYTMLSDIMYKAEYVHSGRKNLPPFTNKTGMAEFMRKAEMLGRILSMITNHTGTRVSVVSGYDSRKCWSQHKAKIEVVANRANANEVTDMLRGNSVDAVTRTTKAGIQRITIHV